MPIFTRSIALILVATLLAVATVTLAMASMTELGHRSIVSGSAAALDTGQMLLYIAAEPDHDVASLPNTVYTVGLAQNNISRLLNIILSFDKNKDLYIIIDLRNTTKSQINIAKMISKSLVAETGKPIVLIGSPKSIEAVVKDLVPAYGIPTFIAKSEDLSKNRYTTISTLVYAIIPEKVAGRTVIVSNVVTDNSTIVGDLNDVLNRVSRYTVAKCKGRTRLAFTLPSWMAELVTQLDVSATFEPWGRIRVRDVLYKALDDGDPSHVWFVYRFADQIIPGEQIWGNGWRNNMLIQSIDADHNDPTGFLADYEPSTRVGAEIVTIDRSDYGLELAKWENRINKDKAVGVSIVQLEPGAVIRYTEKGTHHFRTMYIGQWAKKRIVFWSYSDYAVLVVDWTVSPS